MNQKKANRRQMLSASLLLAGVAASARATAASPAQKASTFVLVHGAWHGGWCYSRVAERLRQQGHHVVALTLSGLADRSHLLSPSIRLQTHVDDVANLLRWEDLSDVVLVGHSYGGMVITGAAEALAPRLKAIVYIDAFVPSSGQSLLDLSPPALRSRLDKLAAGSGGLYLDPIPAKAFNVNEADRAWVDAKCTPQPYATFTDPIGEAEAYRNIRTKFYVRAGAYEQPVYEATAERLKAQQDWEVVRVDSGHDIMVDRPAETAAILLRAAAA